MANYNEVDFGPKGATFFHYDPRDGVSFPFSTVYRLLERLGFDGRFEELENASVRRTQLGGMTITYPVFMDAMNAWEKNAEKEIRRKRDVLKLASTYIQKAEAAAEAKIKSRGGE